MHRHIQQAAREREVVQREQWAKNAMKNAVLWEEGQPAGDAVRVYLAARGLADWILPSCIRQHPGLAYWHTDDYGELHNLGTFPAMLAPIVASDGKLLTIHRTYFSDGCKADVPMPQKLTAAAGPPVARGLLPFDSLICSPDNRHRVLCFSSMTHPSRRYAEWSCFVRSALGSSFTVVSKCVLVFPCCVQHLAWTCGAVLPQ